MKLRILFLILLLINLANIFYTNTLNAQETKDEATLSREVLAEGIKLAKNKKFDKALGQFEAGLKYWQYYNISNLYIHIINDYKQNTIKKKVVQEIFKGVYEDYNDFKPQKALKRINKQIKKNKTYYPAYLLKGQFLANLEKTDEAEEAYTRALELSNKAAQAYVFRGKFYAKQDRRKKAVQDFTQAIKLEPKSAIFRFERGFVYCVQRNYDSAIRDFDVAVKQKPEWEKSTIVIEAFHNRGVLRIQKESYRKAIADFNRTKKIDPDYLNSYLNRGIAYRNLKQYSKAIKDFNFCIKKDPNHRQAYYNRALTYVDKRNYKQAVTDLEKVNKMSPNDKQVLAKLADIANKSGQHQKAIKYLDKIIRIDKKYFWAYYHKGFAYESLRKAKQAIQAFKTFIALAPKQYYKQIALAEVKIKTLRGGR